ncbi:hypothetical protein [Croceicoccus sp. BE223]|uniref:hypothetical protein n=1 Tax=Croceicoccus sp. BE223 TaxID=2817716 RepID=UPI002864C5EF|nr:hypothetical protein [Croceicoccus sp. BE223]MDR7103768.1 hypothetical protein [Croceicoccus sp. BE223]
MSFWTAIVTIVAIVFFTQMVRERRDSRLARRDDDGEATRRTERERQLADEVAELKERIKVLERIAYDDRKRVGAASLADEIESLRD